MARPTRLVPTRCRWAEPRRPDTGLPAEALVAEPNAYLISQVVESLQSDFDDITVSKVRYLDRIGIINPHRSDTGYRRFSQDDIDRLRWVLKQQQQFLPLKVIRQMLESGAWQDGSLPADMAKPRSAAQGSPPSSAVKLTDDQQTKHLSLEQFLEQSKLSFAELRKFEEFKLFNKRSRKQGYTQLDLEVARLALKLLPLGLEPRHLRTYALAAEREADLAQQLVGPLMSGASPSKSQQGWDKLGEIVGLGGELRQALLKRLINEQTSRV